jgi:hypothetical protein
MPSEDMIIANIINLWNAFGSPVCVKDASSRPQLGNSYPSEQSPGETLAGVQ